uniref:Uncharacterized protein n=1 Tax=Klebsiella pneumoniae TaxID=573 RepID=A0A8B0SWE8_KLEPN|nr:hypothetical protein [Klebsiella pneumoniae]
MRYWPGSNKPASFSSNDGCYFFNDKFGRNCTIHKNSSY